MTVNLCTDCVFRVRNVVPPVPCGYLPGHTRLADARRTCEGRYWSPLAPPPAVPAPAPIPDGLSDNAARLWYNMGDTWAIVTDDEDVTAAAELIGRGLATTSWTGDALTIERTRR